MNTDPPSRSPDILAGLNPAQREAAQHTRGPLLVLAGAGSGKTRVITHRIAHLIVNESVPPWRVIAVTFTNKAAGEMRERVERLLGAAVGGAWIGTFHALCLRILRRDGEHVGLAPGFNIYDTDDQMALIKRVLKAEVGSGDAGSPPRSFLSRISRAKNALESPVDIERRAFSPERKLLAAVWRGYDEALRRANAVDFDDLLLRAIDLLKNHPDVAARYAERCEQLLVDEYQDTNRPQYELVRALSSHHGNICVVGDEDQCIYRFRGAELRNILEFESDHSGARTIRLEQNYRSTATILRAAGAVVARNVNRKGKNLWTENPTGERIELYRAGDDRSEAEWIARRAAELAGDDLGYDDIAVLYRTNAQSRLFEEIFRRDRIPYQIVGAVQFYARKEIKDLLAYLKLAANPADDVAFRRVINTPARGIGAKTLGAVERVASTMGLPLMESAGHVLDQQLLSARAAATLERFCELASDLTCRSEEQPVAELLESVVAAVDYEKYLEKSYPGMGAERMENVRGLISAAAEHADESNDATLQAFLDRSALVSDADDVGRQPGVTLMTIHCAKGLEYACVFLTGLEENLFPHAMATGADDDIEEERRLCYVAMTRARERLLLTHARFRRFQGAFMPHAPSRFLDEIPAEVIDEIASAEGLAGEPAAGWAGGDWGRSSASRAALHRRTAPARPDPGRSKVRHEDGFDVGAHVRHPRFGGGQILDREGSGRRLKLTIDFLGHGTKKILPAYTKLRVQVG